MKRQPYYVFKGGRRFQVPSVTTILRLVGDPTGLQNWYYKEGIRAVDEALQALIAATQDEPIRPTRLLASMPPYAERVWDLPKPAADIGTIVHAMVECDVLGLEFVRDVWEPALLEVADVAYRGWVEWRDTRQFVVEASEERLVSTVYEYGGRQDMTNLVAGVDGGRRVLVDIKTSKGTYVNHLLQLAGYAGLWVENHADKPLDAWAILRLSKDDGSLHYDQWPAGGAVSEKAWAGFLAARSIHATFKDLEGAL